MTGGLWPHQAEAVNWLAGRGGSGLLHIPMGGGKTRIAIEAAVRGRRRVLILAPLAVVPVWASEIARWLADDSPRLLELHTGTVASRAHQLAAADTDRSPLAVVANYDAAWRPPLGDRLAAIPWDAVILDESHRVKSPSGRASRWVRGLRERHPRAAILALTGTPMPHGPLDIWAQLRAVAPEVVTRTYTQWRTRYAIPGRLGPWHVVGYRFLDELAARIAPAVFRVDASALTRPECVVVDMPVDLEPVARAAYHSFERDFVIELEAGLLTAQSRLVQLLRLQQMTGGTVPTDSGTPQMVSTAKRDALREVIEGLPSGEPLVVFCVFHADLDAVHEVAGALGVPSAELSGRRNQLAEWQQPDGPPILAAQLRAGSLGVSMVRAAYAVFYSLGYSLGDYDQAIARLVRPGQTRPVTVTRLIARHTVDEHVARALTAKADVAEFVAAALAATRADAA